MSYCRFSTDDHTCDVYVYEDAHSGWVTHVAGNRPVIDRAALPPAPSFGDPNLDNEAWGRAYQAHSEALHRQLEVCERLDLSELSDDAGKSYFYPTPGACADDLERLSDLGFHVPREAIETLRAEQTELDRGE